MPRTPSVRARPAAEAAVPGAARGETDRALAAACQRPGSVVGRPVRAWLFTVARHWAIDQHRARQARPAEVAGMAELTARAAPDQIDAAITRWDLAAAIAGLRPGDRRLLTARYLHDDSITKIAAALGVPAGTVKSRLSAARNALRRRLQSETACLPGRPEWAA
jgi:RNA polymerase sigma-70 factor (ECF subfamily)